MGTCNGEDIFILRFGKMKKMTLWEIIQEMPLKDFVNDEFQRYVSDAQDDMTQQQIINGFLETIAYHGDTKTNSPEYLVLEKYVTENSDNFYKNYLKLKK